MLRRIDGVRKDRSWIRWAVDVGGVVAGHLLRRLNCLPPLYGVVT